MKAEFNNISLHYEEILPEYVERDDIVLLFLHEALGSIGQWRSFPEKLCARLGLKGIVYERQGHGSSSPLARERTNKYLHNYALQELPEFINKVVKVNKRIILIGHSDGGTIALLYAAKFPSKIAGLVTIAAHVLNEPETVAGIEPTVQAFSEGKLDGLRKYHGIKTDELFYAWADTWRSDTFRNWNITDEIDAGDIPGLFMQGKKDQYGTFKQLELINQNYGSKKQIIFLSDCGHHPHLERTEVTIGQIEDWFLANFSENN